MVSTESVLVWVEDVIFLCIDKGATIHAATLEFLIESLTLKIKFLRSGS